MSLLVASPTRPLPHPSWLTEPFWEHAARGELVLPRCNACGKHFFRPEVACTHCLSLDWEWVPSPGTGEVYAFSTVWRPAFPELDVPYVVAAIALEEGCHLMTNLIGCDHTEVRIGLEVEVRFVDIEGMSLPFFGPRALG